MYNCVQEKRPDTLDSLILNVLRRRGSAWEDTFLDVVSSAQDKGIFKHIRVAMFTSRTLDHELEKNTRSVIPYFASSFMIMALFSISKWPSHRSKPHSIGVYFQLPA